jgi:hypothetical protein
MPSSSENVVQVGKLRFKTHYRHFGGDQGPAVEVYAEVAPGQWREVARYDCFLQGPHRHFFYSDGREDRADLGTASLEESLCVCVDELRARLPDVLRRTGYAELAGGVGPDLGPAVDQVEARLRAAHG